MGVLSSLSNDQEVGPQPRSRPQAVVTADPPWTEVFVGETVTLNCEVRGSVDWKYYWALEKQGRMVTLRSSSGTYGSQYILRAVSMFDSGQYWCQAERGTWPRPILTQNPSSGEIYTGDRVTLSCGVGGDSVDWKYLWYKDIQEAALLNTDSSRTDGGEYWCRARRGSVVYYTDHSDSLQIEIIARPQAALTLESGWTEIFTTESVTLRCEIEMGSAGWSYKWYRNGQELPVDSSRRNGDTYTILSAAQLHNGEYTCRGESDHNKLFYSNISNPVKLKVSGKWPKPALTVFPTRGQIYTGDRVTLSCGVGGGSVGWKYLWYKDTQGEVLLNTDSSKTDGSSYTISSAALSHSGEYWCRARRGSVFYYTDRSDSLKLEIIAQPQAVLTLESGWAEIFTTESVTLRCEIEMDSAWWNYKWYKDGQELPAVKANSSSRNLNTYTIISAAQFHNGEYTCRGENAHNKLFDSNVSNPVILKVSGIWPKPVLTVFPTRGQIYTGDRVTLNCGVGGDFVGWKYLWYKDTKGATLANSDTDSSRTNGSSYAIIYAALSHSGEYWCRARRGRVVYYSDYSNSLVLHMSVSSALENLIRICMGVGVFIFLSVIVSDVFWRRVKRALRNGATYEDSFDLDKLNVSSASNPQQQWLKS
ncbi:Fc receptor-like protein 5 [Lepisosteus oculatus]|uniref:Fc receptor-like protein 5 n=1 Tax=Lepisosteus oculatus TaxID=7918 RepID=UPI00371C4D3D